jgi:hypothetical protein
MGEFEVETWHRYGSMLNLKDSLPNLSWPWVWPKARQWTRQGVQSLAVWHHSRTFSEPIAYLQGHESTGRALQVLGATRSVQMSEELETSET